MDFGCNSIKYMRFRPHISKVEVKKIASAGSAGVTQRIVVKAAIKCVCFWYSPISFRIKLSFFERELIKET